MGGMVSLLFAALVAQGTVEEPFVRTLSPSGVKIVLCSRPEASTVAIGAGFRVGSAADGAATCGCAHLLEHVMLTRGTELSSYGELVGRWRALGAEPHGLTFPDYTFFSVSVSPDALARALELLRETILHPAFSASDVATEREALIAELGPYEHDPFVQAYRLAAAAVYGQHNYALPAYGYPRVLRELSTSTLFSRFDEEYSPGRLTITVVGPITVDVLEAVLEETFGHYRPGKTAAPDLEELPPLEVGGRLVEKSPARRAQLIFAFRGPPSGGKDWLPFVVMARVLSGGEGSRLWERLVYQDGIAKNVQLLVEPRVAGGFAFSRIILEPEAIDRCEREVGRVLARMVERPLNPSLVERAMNRVRLDFAQRTESPRALARELVAWDMLGSWNVPLIVGESLARVTTEQLRRIGQLYFASTRARVVAVVPGDYPYAVNDTEVGAVRRRVVEHPFPLVAQSLPNTKVFSFALAVRGGLAGDRVGQEGLGGLVARAILRGGEGENLMDKLLRWGVEAQAGTQRDYTYIMFSAPEGDFEDALHAVSREVRNPRFRFETTVEGLERTRQEILAETATFPSIAEAAERRLWNRAFAGTPYAVFPPGTSESMEALRVRLKAKATAYWELRWSPENFFVAVSGPRPADELVQLVRRAFDPLGEFSARPPLPVDFHLPAVKPETVLIDQPLSQAYLLHAWFAPKSTLDNLVTLLVLREIVVGGRGTRLWRLRQEEGLLYYLTGKVVVTQKVLGFQLAMILPLDKIRAAEEVVRAELDGLTDKPIDAVGLDLARRALKQQGEDRRERGLALVEEEVWFLLAGWSRKDFLKLLDDETPETFQAKAEQFFKKSNMWTVGVGPLDDLRSQLGED